MAVAAPSRRRLASQPQQRVAIDRGNPIASGLFLAWSASVPSADMVSGRVPTTALGTGTVPYAGGVGTKANLSGGGSGAVWSNGLGNPGSSDELTLMAVGYVPAIVSSNTAPAVWVGFGASGYGLWQNGYSGGTVVRSNIYYSPNYSGTSDLSSPSGTLVAGRPFVIISRFKKSALHELWVNGALSASAAAPTSAANLAPLYDPTIYVANDPGYNNLGVQLSAAWTRCLGSDEVAALSANPWQLFKPAARLWALGAGGAADITGASTATVATTGAATGTATVAAASTQTTSVIGSAAGAASISASSAATASTTGSAAAANAIAGTSAATIALTGSATGVLASGVTGQSDATIGITGAASSTSAIAAASARTLPVIGTATAQLAIAAASSAQIVLGGSASATIGAGVIGRSSSTLAITGSAAATAAIAGASAITVPVGTGAAPPMVASAPRMSLVFSVPTSLIDLTERRQAIGLS